MSEPEGFLSRWTRLKREAGDKPDAAPDGEPENETHADAAQPDAAAADGAIAPAGEQAFDLSALPSIESITATTDIRAFMAPGVPADLTRAALRRAWVVDPKIRDFVGIAENQWDFTAADSIPGFGPLSPLDDVRRLVARIMGEEDAEPKAPVTLRDEQNSPDVAVSSDSDAIGSPQPGATLGQTPAAENEHGVEALPPMAGVQSSNVDVASQQEDISSQETAVSIRRGHGGALPK